MRAQHTSTRDVVFTGRSQVLKLVGMERSRGHAVLRFMAGGRALRALGRSVLREQSMTKVQRVEDVALPAGVACVGCRWMHTWTQASAVCSAVHVAICDCMRDTILGDKMFRNGQSFAQMLSCGPAEHEASVSTVLAERSALSRERKSLLAELAQSHAEKLVATLAAEGAPHLDCGPSARSSRWR